MDEHEFANVCLLLYKKNDTQKICEIKFLISRQDIYKHKNIFYSHMSFCLFEGIFENIFLNFHEVKMDHS